MTGSRSWRRCQHLRPRADPEAALAELAEAWALTREDYRRVHGALAVEVARAGVGLNALVVQKLAETIDVPDDFGRQSDRDAFSRHGRPARV